MPKLRLKRRAEAMRAAQMTELRVKIPSRSLKITSLRLDLSQVKAIKCLSLL